MIKRMVVMLVIAGLVLGGVFGFQAFKSKMIRQFMSAGQPPQTVSTIKATYAEWQAQDRSVGTLAAVRGADLAPEVAGTVQRIFFQSGDTVKAGTPLVQLNAESDEARLKSLEATAALAQRNFERDSEQLKVGAISQAALDVDAANVKSAQAQADEQRALVQKKLIRAPFDGRAGIRAVDLGQYVGAGTKIVTLQSLDPVYVDFLVPQARLARYRVGPKIVVTAEPLRSLICPAVTTVSPSASPESTATWSPRVAPVVTNVCCATSSVLPSAPLRSSSTNTVLP